MTLNPSHVIVSTIQFRFDSARDAIDAISAFESRITDDWEYQIQCVGEVLGETKWEVRANCLVDHTRGYVAVCS